MKHRLFWYAGLLVTLLSIEGCGGGGGGGGAGGGGSPAASLALFAGDMGGPGNVDGTGPAARFTFPRGVATDSTGNVYVADTNNSTIRKITPAGVVSTVVGVAGQAGFAPGALPGLLAFPIGVAVGDTSLYIALYQGVAVVQNRP